MSAYYVIKTLRRLYFFYREDNDALMYRMFDGGRLSPEVCLMRGTRPYFSVTLSHDEPRLFCQDTEGGLWLLTEKNDQWQHRNLRLTSDTGGEDGDIPRRHDLLITPMMAAGGLCIIYNTVSMDGAGHYLFLRQTGEDGSWRPGTRIDRFLPLPYALYDAQATSREHLLLFYQTYATENTLGYREVTPSRFGPYQRIHSTSGAFSDTAFLTTSDAVHVLYVVKTLFSCQLLYRRRTDTTFSAPVLLWEAPRIDQCLLSFVFDNLFATCMINGQLYMAVSENRGESFSRMALYKRKFCYEPAKAVFISSSPMAENDIFLRQVYVDRNLPWDTQMIPDLYDNFYHFPEAESAPKETEAPRDVLSDMQDRLAAAQRKLEDRDRQLMQMMMQMKTGDTGANT